MEIDVATNEYGALHQSIVDDCDRGEDGMQTFHIFCQNADRFITMDELKLVLVFSSSSKGGLQRILRK